MQWFADRGVAAYALDFRGHGRSGGKPGFVRRWDEYLDDLSRFLAIDELKKTDTPLFVLGHSHGGLVTAAAAQRGLLNHAAGIILVAPYLALKMPVPIRKRLIAAVASHLYPSLPIKSGLNGGMLTRDQTMIALGKGDPFTRGIATPRWFTQASQVQIQVRATPGQFKQPLLMLLPGDDTVADSSASVEFFNHVGSTDKTLLHYPENRHELLRELDREAVFEDLLKWIKSHI
jgi:alpha-beta hydrolase superfamily lysophospholipase